jgi:hypothetical protein
MQQRQQIAAQIAPLQARFQQISACMAQDQVELRGAAQQPTINDKPTFQPGMRQEMGNSQAILAEIQQHQVEMQQIRTQMAAIQNQDAQMAAQIANLQNQFQREAGAAQASLSIKLKQRERLANEFDTLDRQRVAPFDPAAFTTPEIDDLARRRHSLKTYSDLPLEPRREELLAQFDCGAAKEPARPANSVPTVSIKEPAFTLKRPVAVSSSAPAPSVMRALPASPALAVPAAGMPPIEPVQPNRTVPSSKSLPAAATAVRPPPNAGDPAEVIITNNHTGAVRVFGISLGAEREQFVRSLQSGEETMIPAKVGETLIIKATTGGQELQRRTIGKKLEVLKVGGRSE